MLWLTAGNFEPSSEQISYRIRLFKQGYHATDHVTLRATALSPNLRSQYLRDWSFAVFKTFEICSKFLTFGNTLSIDDDDDDDDDNNNNNNYNNNNNNNLDNIEVLSLKKCLITTENMF